MAELKRRAVATPEREAVTRRVPKVLQRRIRSTLILPDAGGSDEVERAAAGQSALGRVTDRLFGGSPEKLLLHLVDTDLDADELRRMRDLLDDRLREMEDDA